MSHRDTLEALTKISSEICTAYVSFDNLMIKDYEECRLRIQGLKQHTETYNAHKETSECLLREMQLFPESEQVYDNQTSAKTKGANMEELKKNEEALSESLRAKEKQLDKVKDDIAACMSKKKSLDSLRNKARLLRVITSTSFDYLKDSNVTGYTIGNNCVKPFEYDLSKIKPEDVPASLWSHLKKTFSEDYKDIKRNITLT